MIIIMIQQLPSVNLIFNQRKRAMLKVVTIWLRKKKLKKVKGKLRVLGLKENI